MRNICCSEYTSKITCKSHGASEWLCKGSSRFTQRACREDHVFCNMRFWEGRRTRKVGYGCAGGTYSGRTQQGRGWSTLLGQNTVTKPNEYCYSEQMHLLGYTLRTDRGMCYIILSVENNYWAEFLAVAFCFSIPISFRLHPA